MLGHVGRDRFFLYLIPNRGHDEKSDENNEKSELNIDFKLSELDFEDISIYLNDDLRELEVKGLGLSIKNLMFKNFYSNYKKLRDKFIHFKIF